jgi:hypothetical protein
MFHDLMTLKISLFSDPPKSLPEPSQSFATSWYVHHRNIAIVSIDARRSPIADHVVLQFAGVLTSATYPSCSSLALRSLSSDSSHLKSSKKIIVLMPLQSSVAFLQSRPIPALDGVVPPAIEGVEHCFGASGLRREKRVVEKVSKKKMSENIKDWYLCLAHKVRLESAFSSARKRLIANEIRCNKHYYRRQKLRKSASQS